MLRTALAALTLLASALAQTASFTTYGLGCGALPPPLIQAVTMPRIGMAFTVRHIALPASQTPISIDWPAILIGMQQTSLPVPPLSSLQPANCYSYTSADFAQLMVWTGSSYPNTFTMQIPNDVGLIGLPLYMQWASLYIRQGWAQMVRVTNGGVATIGL